MRDPNSARLGCISRVPSELRALLLHTCGPNHTCKTSTTTPAQPHIRSNVKANVVIIRRILEVTGLLKWPSEGEVAEATKVSPTSEPQWMLPKTGTKHCTARRKQILPVSCTVTYVRQVSQLSGKRQHQSSRSTDGHLQKIHLIVSVNLRPSTLLAAQEARPTRRPNPASKRCAVRRFHTNGKGNAATGPWTAGKAGQGVNFGPSHLLHETPHEATGMSPIDLGCGATAPATCTQASACETRAQAKDGVVRDERKGLTGGSD